MSFYVFEPEKLVIYGNSTGLAFQSNKKPLSKKRLAM